MNKRVKRKYLSGEQQSLLDLHTGHYTRDFWREIGILGFQNERSGRPYLWKGRSHQRRIPLSQGGKMT